MVENQEMDMMAENVGSADVAAQPIYQKKKFNLYSKFEKLDFPFAYALCIIPVAHFLVFWLYVNFSSIAMAFTYNEVFSLENFRAVFASLMKGETGAYGNFVMAESLKRSLFIWFFSKLFCYPLGLITVYVLTCKIRGHWLYRMTEVIPTMMGSVIWSIIMKDTVNATGPIVGLLEKWGIGLDMPFMDNGLLADPATSFPTLIVILFFGSMVSNSPIMTGAYSRIGDELFESCDLDGAGFWRQFITIAIPGVWPTITTTMVFSLASFFTADCGVFLYTEGQYNTSTIGFEMFWMQQKIAAQNGVADYGYPSAFGLVLTIFTFPICVFGRWGLERLCDTIET